MFRRPSSYMCISSPSFHIAAVSLSSSLGFWFSICPPLPSLSLSPTVCHLAAVDQTGRLPLFMTADMWQFPFVNDKKCANYLSGCFAANQSLTSCECAAMFACVCARSCASVRASLAYACGGREAVVMGKKLDERSMSRCLSAESLSFEMSSPP